MEPSDPGRLAQGNRRALMTEADGLRLVRMGNLEGDWRPLLFALRDGCLDSRIQRQANDGRWRPILLSLILIKAPLVVVSEAIRLGTPLDPDHYIAATGSGQRAKIDLLHRHGTPCHPLSIPPANLLVMAINQRSLSLTQSIWRLFGPWNPAELRETARLFDIALSVDAGPELLGFLLSHTIGPSTHLLQEGASRLSGDGARLLITHRWPLPIRHASVACC